MTTGGRRADQVAQLAKHDSRLDALRAECEALFAELRGVEGTFASALADVAKQATDALQKATDAVAQVDAATACGEALAHSFTSTDEKSDKAHSIAQRASAAADTFAEVSATTLTVAEAAHVYTREEVSRVEAAVQRVEAALAAHVIILEASLVELATRLATCEDSLAAQANKLQFNLLGAGLYIIDGKLVHEEAFTFAVSDEVTPIGAGAAKVKFRMPYALFVTGIRASLNVASRNGALEVDVNQDGKSILFDKLVIDQGTLSSLSNGVKASRANRDLVDDAEITVDVDAAGVGAKGLKVTILGYRP